MLFVRPLLVFINDLLEVVSVNALQFGKDLKILTEVILQEDSERLQQSISVIEGWCTVNSMSVNPAASAQVFFFIRSSFQSST